MLDTLQVGQTLIFRGRPHTVKAIKEDMDVVWLIDGSNEPEVYGRMMVLQEASPIMDAAFIPRHTKSEIDARLDELRPFLMEVMEHRKTFGDNGSFPQQLQDSLSNRMSALEDERGRALDDIFSAIVESHKILCHVKQMGEKEAYGQDPAFYYSAGVAGEAGELLNKMVKAFRNGGDATAGLRAAVVSELPDVVIYAFVLAYVLEIDLTRLVTEKASVVVKRAMEGYYGGPLIRASEEPCPTCGKKPRGPRCPIKCDENH